MVDDTSFLSRIRKGVSDSVARPLPGSVRPKISRSEERPSSIPELSSSGSRSRDLGSSETAGSTDSKSFRLSQFESILSAENVDLSALRKLSWNGIPQSIRPTVWQMLLGYLPTNRKRREAAISRKRKEYNDSIPVYFNIAESDRTTQEGETLRQILVDLRRLCPDTPLFQQEPVQRAMERILFIWSIRHPASGYVQGMDDLLTPIFLVCMLPFGEDVLRLDVATLDKNTLMKIEADAYWCLTKLLDNIQDHYTFSQPGLQRMVLRLEDLVHRIDAELFDHFESEGLQFMQFSFRWMNCLLLRELPLRSILRLWDTYLAEPCGGFENFHVYVCAVLLKTFKSKLLQSQFQELLMFLQELPTSEWGEVDCDPILSQAYILSTLFDSSPSHLS